METCIKAIEDKRLEVLPQTFNYCLLIDDYIILKFNEELRTVGVALGKMVYDYLNYGKDNTPIVNTVTGNKLVPKAYDMYIDKLRKDGYELYSLGNMDNMIGYWR